MIFLGRLLIGSYFLIDGLTKLANFSESAARIAAYDIPIAWFFLLLITGIEGVMAVLLIVRYHTKIAAAVLGLFIIGEIIFTQMSPLLTEEWQLAILMKDLLIFASLLSVYSHSRGYAGWHIHNTRIRPADDRFELDESRRIL